MKLGKTLRGHLVCPPNYSPKQTRTKTLLTEAGLAYSFKTPEMEIPHSPHVIYSTVYSSTLMER